MSGQKVSTCRISHVLPSGLLVQEYFSPHGATYDVVGTDAKLDAVDLIALGQIAEAALHVLAIDTRCTKCGKFLSGARISMRIDRCDGCDRKARKPRR